MYTSMRGAGSEAHCPGVCAAFIFEGVLSGDRVAAGMNARYWRRHNSAQIVARMSEAKSGSCLARPYSRMSLRSCGLLAGPSHNAVNAIGSARRIEWQSVSTFVQSWKWRFVDKEWYTNWYESERAVR